jgi:hypothetical protein
MGRSKLREDHRRSIGECALVSLGARKLSLGGRLVTLVEARLQKASSSLSILEDSILAEADSWTMIQCQSREGALSFISSFVHCAVGVAAVKISMMDYSTNV